MARGWESKNIEQQQEERASASQPGKPRLAGGQIRDLQRRQTLSLARQQALHQLEAASDPQLREMLQAAIAHLDAQLQKFNSG